ncbi:hypothetical protein ABAC460_13710 [Asticcacaulis sp. AC460]|uniref:peptide MFS transporter n=1 Tax=Asticcacaulis sp. AC460 TaxID=1282360 RepID=UPI0003C40712|nr:hypothetical protein [Asticcacaulis sp. AC460]ESQ89121.1 hypothetical protein ABAC460_13710 [Asticcacaulis sp. AC460]
MLNLVLLGGIVITLLTAIPVVLQMRNHPKGLIVCFFIEMWERFSFYGMRGLLIFYLTKQFLFDDAMAVEQYASYMTLIYLVPLVGGFIADRWLGTRRAVMFGGILLVLGHAGMALEGQPAQQNLTYHGQTYEVVREDKAVKLKVGDALYSYKSGGDDSLVIDGLPQGSPLPSVLAKGDYEVVTKTVTPWAETAFFISISLIIMGVGFLKANISSLVGQLYKDRDPRRDSGFQLYYFGINLGSFWAAIICGWLGTTVGWWAGFGAAGIGMVLGLVGFMIGKPWLLGKGEAPNLDVIKEKIGGFISREHAIYALSLLGVAVVYYLVQHNDIVFYCLVVLTLVILGYVIYSMFTRFTRVENFRIGLALVLSVSSIVFFTLEELAGSALNLFSDRHVDLTVFAQPVVLGNWVFASRDQLAAMTMQPGMTWVDTGLTPAQTSTLFSAAFILILAPIFAALFTYLGRRNADPDPVKKFAFGIVAAGFAFIVLVWGGHSFVNALFQLPLIFLVMNYFLTVVGEMALSPVGLSQQTKLSPPSIVSTMMALWFTGLSWAQFFGGKITEQTKAFTIGGEVVDPGQSLNQTLSVFSTIGIGVIAFGVALFILSFFIKGWAGGANDGVTEEAAK